MFDESVCQRFWAKVEKAGPDDCWTWLAGWSENERGMRYGRFSYVSSGKRGQLAHRCAFEITKGRIPDDLLVRHKCDNGMCVNPNHLELGSHQDNVHDRYDRGRARHALGEAHGNAKLTESKVREIRAMVEAGQQKKRVAEMFGISEFGVRHALSGWKHVA
jgi:hypothetical protein